MIRVVLCVVAVCCYFAASASEDNRELGVYGEAIFYSNSVWYGWANSGGNPVVSPALEVDLYQTGFGLEFWAAIPLDREEKVYDDYEFMLSYSDLKLENSRFQFDFHGFINYIIFPNVKDYPFTDSDGSVTYGVKKLWNMSLGVTFDQLFPVGSSFIVPTFNIYYYQPVGKGELVKGSIYDITLEYVTALNSSIDCKLFASGYYHNKLCDVTAWGAFMPGAELSYKLSESTVLKGSVNYQKSFHEEVNPNDEFWGGVGIGYTL